MDITSVLLENDISNPNPKINKNKINKLEIGVFFIIILSIANLIYLIRINYMINVVIPYVPKIQELVDIACTYVNCSTS
jgi:hypothetical protein